MFNFSYQESNQLRGFPRKEIQETINNFVDLKKSKGSTGFPSCNPVVKISFMETKFSVIFPWVFLSKTINISGGVCNWYRICRHTQTAYVSLIEVQLYQESVTQTAAMKDSSILLLLGLELYLGFSLLCLAWSLYSGIYIWVWLVFKINELKLYWNYTQSCSWDDETDYQKNVVC